MRENQGYYSIVQYLPFPDRLEFVNIGVVLLAPAGQGVHFRIQPDFRRLNRLFGRQDRRKVQAMIEGLARRLQTDFGKGGSPFDLSRFASMRTSNVQLSQPLPIAVVGSPELVLEELFAEMVVTSFRQSRLSPVVSVVRQKLAEAGVLDLVEKKPAPVTLPQGISIKVPFGYQNGAYNLIDPIRLEGETVDALKNASARAVEGRWLSEAPGPSKRLVVVGDLSDQPARFAGDIEQVMQENGVKFYDLSNLAPLVEDIRSHSRSTWLN